ncbi:MAG TPA: hypothetical protein VFT45_28470 [Longimicrobium sp.]|nr:hypothetical protein [Longimicrobium sp.]
MTSTSETPSVDEIRQAELEALQRELGLVGMIRYLQKVRPGSGDYTAERAELVGNMTVDEIYERIEKRRAEAAERTQD